MSRPTAKELASEIFAHPLFSEVPRLSHYSSPRELEKRGRTILHSDLERLRRMHALREEARIKRLDAETTHVIELEAGLEMAVAS